MKKLRFRFPAAAAVLTLLASGCFSVQVRRGVDDPDRYFRRAHSEIESLAKDLSHREGEVHGLQILAYDRSERKLVRVGVPMWLVNVCLEAGEEAADEDSPDFDFERRYDVAWRSIRGLDKIGPGLLLEAIDDESRVLIWLR